MYGQYQTPAVSAVKWIFFGFFGIILMAILLGANIKDAKWLNSDIAAAEASRINIEAAHEQAINSLRERLLAAQTEAEIQKIQLEQKKLDAQYQHDIQALDQDLLHRELAFKTWMTVLTFLGAALSIAIILSTILWFGSKAVANVRSVPVYESPMKKSVPSIEKKILPSPQREPAYDPLQSPSTLFERRLSERLEEIAAQHQEVEVFVARMKALTDPAQMSKEEYHKRPLAI